MRTALALLKGRQGALFLLGFLLVIFCLYILGIDGAPPWVEDGAASDFELDGIFCRLRLSRNRPNLTQHGGLGVFAVRVEDGDEATGHEVEDLALHVGECCGYHARWDNGVVVGDLRRVEDLLRLR